MKEKEILSQHHLLIKHLVKLRTSRKYRREVQRVFIEGRKIVTELGPSIQTLIVRKGEQIPLGGKETYIVSDQVFKKISGVKSPEGVAAEIKLPPLADLSKKKWILALDTINDPGNLGTLIRTALAFGFEGIFLTPCCVDPYNEKALRAAKGATFKMPMQIGSLSSLSQNFHFYIADLEGECIDSIAFKSPAILLLGNESRGISKEVQKMGTPVTIPITSNVESLNVTIAGGILMHAIKHVENK